jgi:hypothetical protein
MTKPTLLTVTPPATVRPPFVIFSPPFTVTVERARVEGIVGVPEGGGYTTPFTEDTKRLPVLSVKELRAFVMIGAVPVFVRPPLKLMVDAFRVEGIPPGTYGAPLMVVRLIFVVFTPPLRVVRPDATVRPEFTVAEALRNAVPDVVRLLLIDVGLFNTTCVPDIVLPPQLNVPVPDCVRLPFTLMVDAFRVEGMPLLPGGGYTAPFTEDTKKLLTATAGRVAVGWMTGTHSPNIWMDETLLLM